MTQAPDSNPAIATYVIDLDDSRAGDYTLTGGKGASLARAAQRGLEVPRGFVITRSFFDIMEQRGWRQARDVVAAEVELALGRLTDGPVAVRSSALAEDGAKASFAGQHETRLNVQGLDAVLDAVEACWRSSRASRARDYRMRRGAEGDGFAVVVQEMVAADASLVAFSLDPLTGDRAHVLIDAAWGLGESLVGGTTNADMYRVRKHDFGITSRRILDKERMTVPSADGTREITVPGELRGAPALDDDQIRRVARLAVEIENEMGHPVDIECAVAGNRLVLLQARPVTAAPEFPVEWAGEDAELCWFRGDLNFPAPVSPLFGSWLERVFVEGGTRSLRVGGPPIRSLGRRINTFWYEADVPLDLSPEDRAAWVTSSEGALDDTLDHLGELWERKYMPEIQATVTLLERTSLESLSNQRLAAHLEDALARSVRAWEIHFLALTPALVALNEFEKLCIQIFGADGRLAAYEMLQGFDNKTLEMERALRSLSRSARCDQAIVDVIVMGPAGDAVEALRGDPRAAGFVPELDAFLAAYGRRFQRFELMTPTWREDPAPVIEALRLLLNDPKEQPVSTLAAAAERRERAVTRARDRSKDLPAETQEHFRRALAAAQAAIIITEDHGFYIDAALQYEIRRLVLECGRRLGGARLITDENDVFMLTLEEAASCLTNVESPHLREEVSTRRSEMERWTGVKAPTMIGGPPAEESGRFADAWASFRGTPIYEITPDGAIRGVAASPGRGSGAARVITTARDAWRLMPGDVLVVDSTAPMWAPLLSSASALVSERGGPLSHCAILAREYALPAVVGVDGATRRIHDGDIVEVDGSAGLIRILHPTSPCK